MGIGRRLRERRDTPMLAKFSFVATVNYPESEVDTPHFREQNVVQVLKLLEHLLTSEGEASSFLITVAKERGNAQA